MTDPAPQGITDPGGGRRIAVNPPVFFVSAALTIAFAVSGALFAEQAGRVFSRVQTGLSPEFTADAERLDLSIPQGERWAFRYSIRARAFRAPSFVWAETRKLEDEERQHYRAMAHSSEGEPPHDVTGFTRAQLIDDLLNRYARFCHARRMQ
jgi:hypothetical protein